MTQPTNSASYSNDPVETHRRRLARLAAVIGRLARAERWVAQIKLIPIYAIVGLVVFDPTVAGALLIPLVWAPLMTALQETLLRAWRRRSAAANVHHRALGRLADEWIGIGPTGRGLAVKDHPYAGDLDIVGDGSLFQLLCIARTPWGEQALAHWLLEPAAELAEVRQRQAAIAGLAADLDVHERLASTLSIVSRRRATALDRWLAGTPLLATVRARWGARGAVAALVAGSAAAAAWGGLWWIAPLAAFVGIAGLYATQRSALAAWSDNVGKAMRALGAATRLARAVDGIDARSPLAAALLDDLQPLAARSTSIAASGAWMLLQNPGVTLIAIAVAPAIEGWRRRLRHDAPRALAALAQLEALLCLAAHAFENPLAIAAELTDEGPCFDGAALVHPLMPRGRCVPNDVRLDREQRVLLLSGSNMSGKSTLMRTVGVNAVMALAGGRACAERLRISSLSVGASLRVQDSIHEGVSRFMAEILRLRRLVDLAGGTRPLLFLLDELLHGTNSADRLAGARAVVCKLVERGAAGIVTTHDLALTAIVDDLAPKAANVHCADEVVDGRLVFDYRLRPGVVQRSNALELMRGAGLDV